jgi:hypothetical protein
MKRTRIAALVAAALALPSATFAAAPAAPAAPAAAPAPSPAPKAYTHRSEIVIERDGDVLMLNGSPLDHALIASNAHNVHGDAWKRWADEFSREMRSSVGTLYSQRVDARKIVKGAPYSAEIVTEMNQALPDGNVISRKSSGRIWRDAEGRTRQETASEGKQGSVHINDPVEGKRYIVSHEGKRAVELPAPKASDIAAREKERAEREAERAKERAERSKERAEREAERARERAEREAERAKERAARGDTVRNRQVVRAGGTEIRIEDGKVFIDGKEVPANERVERRSGTGKTVVVENGRITIDGKEMTPPIPPHPPVPGVTVHRYVGADGAERKEVHVQAIRTGDGRQIFIAPPPAPPAPGLEALASMPPIPPMPPMPGVQTLRFESTAKLGKGVTTNLGMRDFDGVKAEGRSTVWTIPAGEIGNRNPINITSETWYSPDLQVTVMSRYNDPRTGESVYRLANIQRAEPPADLFKAPEKVIRR